MLVFSISLVTQFGLMRVHLGADCVGRLMITVLEKFLVLMIEAAGEETTESGATNVHPHVVGQNTLWVSAETE